MPVVDRFHLEPVFDFLIEQAIAVFDAVAVKRHIVYHGRIQKTGREPAQPAVADHRRRQVLQLGDVPPPVLQHQGNLVQYAQRMQVMVHHPANQVFRRKVVRLAVRRVMLRLPPRRDFLDHRTRNRVMQFPCIGVFQFLLKLKLNNVFNLLHHFKFSFFSVCHITSPSS